MKRSLLFLFITCHALFLLAQNDPAPTPQWRPVYHFTPVKNWTNDPNGPIYLNGVYHLYNQQNPFENKWGHMSWGHATSTDLVHWKHHPIAIPETIDKDTTWRFSGCAVWDKNNTSGFCKAGGCLVAIYTADQPNLKKESQYIAYSNDGGMSFTNYEKNPVIDLNKKDFRDPNVSWNKELNKWLMVVALPTEHKVRFYTSADLKEWELLSEFGNQGYTHAAWECPSFFQLPVEGSLQKKKWVLMVSAGSAKGPYMQYYTGDFDGRSFRNDNPPDTVLTVDYGDSFYAAIPWNDFPGDKKVLIGWMVPGPQETWPWKGQMSISRDMSLRQTAHGLRLIQKPAALIENDLAKLSGNKITLKSGTSINGEKKLADMKGNAYWLDAVVELKPGTDFGFKIGRKNEKMQTIVGYNASANQLYVDRSLSGDARIRKGNERLTADAGNIKGSVRIQVLVDRSSLEVFFNNGEKVLTTYIYPDEDAVGLSAFSTGGSVVIKSLTVWDLSKNIQEVE